MRKVRTLLIFGFWITILPYLGFSYAWKDMLGTLSGLALVCFSYVFYQDYKDKEIKKHKNFDNFRENDTFNKEIMIEDNQNIS